MCGIAGIATFESGTKPDAGVLGRMTETLRHRGPDDGRVDIRANVGLGIRRLSVIDVEGGAQPVFNEDRTIRAVFNGEIYNFQRLRAQLEAAGHTFTSHSDSEVLVHAYETWGLEFLQRLNGMFALALHDAASKRLVLARDPIGIKPLYYTLDSDRIVFGSEIKAVLAAGGVDRSLDVDALAEFLTWEYVPGSSTLFRSVRKLRPGELLDLDLGKGPSEPRRYWQLSIPGSDEKIEKGVWTERLEEALDRATKAQLVSDVPLGAFLSGGIDSSLIVSSTGPVKTFSIGFEDPSYNELPWARRVADHLGVPHVQEVITSDTAELFDTLIEFLDDPIADFSVFPTYLVSRLARRDVTVVLSGDGGDELFGGYETYTAQLMAEFYSVLPAGLRSRVLNPLVRSLKPRATKRGLLNMSRRFAEGLQHPADQLHARWRRFVDDDMLGRLLTPDAASARTRDVGQHITDLVREVQHAAPVDRLLYVDLKSYLCDNILTKVDRMSMAVSLEARVPYLDVDLVSLAFTVPAELKVTPMQRKVLLKEVARRRLPEDVVSRSKQGFSIPMKHWLKTRFRPIVEGYLNVDALRRDGLFNPETVDELRKAHLEGRADHSHLLWSLVVFQAWKRRWADTPAPEADS